MIHLFQWVSLRDRRINFGLIGGRVVTAFGGATPHGAVTVDRLNTVLNEPEGVSADGRTLNIGALGIASIAEHLASIPTYAKSPKRMHAQLMRLVAGSMHGPEMVRATIRVAMGDPGVGGDTGMFIAAAKRQLQPWTHEGATIRLDHHVAM